MLSPSSLASEDSNLIQKNLHMFTSPNNKNATKNLNSNNKNVQINLSPKNVILNNINTNLNNAQQ